MNILFLSNRNDPIITNAFDYFNKKYANCFFNQNIKADIIITNYYAPSNTKTIFYATDPAGDIPTDLNSRRLMLNWFKSCEVICSSWAIAKKFHDTYRIKPSVQYPYVPKQITEKLNIVYNDFDINNLRELKETFIQYTDNSDLAYSKLYLNNSDILDLGMCYAATYGVPIVTKYNSNILEFITNEDFLITDNMTNNQIITGIKTLLKNNKKCSEKYQEMATMDDKIKKALSKKPTELLINEVKSLRPNLEKSIPHKMKIVNRKLPIQQQATKPLTSTTIYVTAGVNKISGYDNFAFEVINGLKNNNVDVRINLNSGVDYNICPDYFKKIHMYRPSEAWQIIITPPCTVGNVNDKTIIYTMWETDYLEPSWVTNLNKAAFIIVPSQWAIDSFKKSGVTVPIYKISLGHNPLLFSEKTSFPEQCTFGSAAALGSGGLRKNTAHMVKLFKKAFPNESDVRFKVKISPYCIWKNDPDPRIETIKAFLPIDKLCDWYNSISVFVNGSYAEGFGLHLIEAMACGRPIISTHYSSVTEYFNEEIGYVAEHKIIPAFGGAYTGHWAKPVDDSIIQQMRRVYSDKEMLVTKGKAACLKASEFTWEAMSKQLVNLLIEQKIINLY